MSLKSSFPLRPSPLSFTIHFPSSLCSSDGIFHLGLIQNRSFTVPSVYYNCSGHNPTLPPSDTTSFKHQIRVNPLEINKNGTGWEEWVFLAHNVQPDGSMLTYGYKWALGDPSSANVSQHAFSAWAYFPNGTFYNQLVRDIFKYEEHPDGGLTYLIANNNLTWEPLDGIWHSSINAGGWVIETNTEKQLQRNQRWCWDC